MNSFFTNIDLFMVHFLLLYHDITLPPRTVQTNISDCIGFKEVMTYIPMKII